MCIHVHAESYPMQLQLYEQHSIYICMACHLGPTINIICTLSMDIIWLRELPLWYIRAGCAIHSLSWIQSDLKMSADAIASSTCSLQKICTSKCCTLVHIGNWSVWSCCTLILMHAKYDVQMGSNAGAIRLPHTLQACDLTRGYRPSQHDDQIILASNHQTKWSCMIVMVAILACWSDHDQLCTQCVHD